jgi:hypothetical protein
MAKKKKSKLKKFGAALAAGLGAAALMNRRNQNNMYLAEEGGDRSTPIGSGFITRKRDNRGNTAPMFDYGDTFQYMKKPGS